MSNYSPYKAAIAALHTPEAIAYYNLRAQQDFQTMLCVAVAVGAALYEAAVFAYNLGVFTYNLGVLVRAWYESTKPQPEIVAIVPAQFTDVEIEDSIIEGEIIEDNIIEGEIIENAPILLLGVAPQITITPQSTLNQKWIANNIIPLPPIKALPAAKTKKTVVSPSLQLGPRKPQNLNRKATATTV